MRKEKKKMKLIAKKIKEYIKKSKRAKLYGIFGMIYLIMVIFVMNDAWLYQTPIAKLTKVAGCRAEWEK